MNSFSERIILAVELLIDNRLKQLKFDKTVEAIVEEKVANKENTYKVSYKQGVFTAYCIVPGISYNVGDRVFVKIPEGDFTNKKYIEGVVPN